MGAKPKAKPDRVDVDALIKLLEIVRGLAHHPTCKGADDPMLCDCYVMPSELGEQLDMLRRALSKMITVVTEP